ncbi:MAG: TetR family transcriptional regulator [Actinobacteria bacterium]|nr:TetR family transcriptional regulator [Actinomycetota bacterium]
MPESIRNLAQLVAPLDGGPHLLGFEQIPQHVQVRLVGARHKETAVWAALDLVDESRIASLTMRELAQRLGVEAMSLYNHVDDKADIVEGIVDFVVDLLQLPASTADWATAIRTCALSAHDAFMRHPWACTLVLSPGRIPTAPNARFRYMEWLLELLVGPASRPS